MLKRRSRIWFSLSLAAIVIGVHIAQLNGALVAKVPWPPSCGWQVIQYCQESTDQRCGPQAQYYCGTVPCETCETNRQGETRCFDSEQDCWRESL